jgi:hypothetical protein
METEDMLLERLRALPPAAQKAVLDLIDSLMQHKPNEPPRATRPPLNFPVDHWGNWPADLALRRQDLYGQRGR